MSQAAAMVGASRWGRCFVGPLFDVALIGGGLSVVAIPLLSSAPAMSVIDLGLLSAALLAANSAHFAASTVRLYTKPGALRDWPFVTCGLPLAVLATLTLCIAFSDRLGPHLYALAFTWSPFHYAAQAYGLSTMYCSRSGYRLEPRDRHLLYAACLLPFAYSFSSAAGVGLEWFVSADWLASPAVAPIRGAWVAALGVLTLAAPAALFTRLRSSNGAAPPWIVSVLILSNGLWWVIFPYFSAFAWATVFHGVQYLAIVFVFHARERRAAGSVASGPLLALRFYASCLALAYALFHALPIGYTALGFGYSESVLLVVAMINIHHFIVDRYIWRVRNDPRNAAVVGS
ncbi:MAG: hypothetical protein VX681_15850 [Myxococcota bacterium]|nr:hypothetical protein [Myxococcota bacterium]